MSSPYDPPPRTRSRSQSRSRISTALEAAEHLAEDVEIVGQAAVKATRVAGRIGRDYEEAYPDAWLSRPVGGGGSGGRSERQGHRDEGDEEWQSRKASRRSSTRALVQDPAEQPLRSTSRSSRKPCPPGQPAYDDDAVDTFRAALADAQEFVDEIQVSSKQIRRLRQDLTGAVYTRKLTRRHSKNKPRPFDTEKEARFASLTTAVRKQVLLTFHTIYALKKQFPAFRTGARSITSENRQQLNNEVNHLVNSFADALNFIEDLAEEEKKDVESGALDVRMLEYIRVSEPGLQDQEVLSELKAAKREAEQKGVEELKLESFARRCALQRPFSEIDRALQEIDLFENGLKAVKKDSEGLFDRVVEGIEHVFHRKSKLPRSRFSKKHSSRSMLELGHSSKKGAEDSDDSDAELLGPDGQLPYHVPSDDPNGDQLTVEDQLEDARRKRRLERLALPWIVFEWVGIIALYIYWAVARGLGNPNPLGNIDLGSHFGDDAWSDTTDGPIPTATMTSYFASSAASTTAEVPSSLNAISAVPTAKAGSSATATPISTSSPTVTPAASSSSASDP